VSSQFKTISEVWAAIDSGKPVYWGNKGYRVLPVDHDNENSPTFTLKNGKLLRVTFTANWFGSLLQPSELGQLFTEEEL
jgi:hypothetical protein